MSEFSDFLFGKEATKYENPYAGQIDGDINQLRNSNVGALKAQQSESTISRRLKDRLRLMRNSSGFGKNAAVMSKLTSTASEDADNATVNANIAGAEFDQNSKLRATQLAQQQAQMDFAVNNENQRREDNSGFANSLVGGLITSAVSYATGGLVSGGINSLMKGGGGDDDGTTPPDTGTWKPDKYF